MVHFEAMAVISIVAIALLSDIICFTLLIVFIFGEWFKCFVVAFVFFLKPCSIVICFKVVELSLWSTDPYSLPQGLDYCLLSLILSDFLHNFVLGSLSICSSVFEYWIFGNGACKLFACTAYAFWLIDIMSLFWLSIDRLMFITDTKYSTNKMRTKARFVQYIYLFSSHFVSLHIVHINFSCVFFSLARFICKIVLSWFVSAVYSFAPIVVQKTGRYVKHSFVCILNSLNLESYYATVTIIIILPCFLGTNFNFARIFFMRIRYLTHRRQSKLSEADIELLMDPNHKMSALLALVFWITWLPYIVYMLADASTEPSPFEYWSGKFGALPRLPILTMCFPRYRNYLCSFFELVKSHSIPLRFNRFKETLSTQPPEECSLHIWMELQVLFTMEK